jgi:ureidoacrylate peracid hydrolase
MHRVSIRDAIVQRVLQRRGRLHLFDRLDPKRTALVVIDMQNAFVAPGAPAEVPASRDIVPGINRLAAELRGRGVAVIWVLHENLTHGENWSGFFDVFVKPEARAATAKALASGSEMQKLFPLMKSEAVDIFTTKSRYSALIPADSPLKEILADRQIDTLLIAGTKTNVCCESTARDAMMLDYKVVLLSDCTAALSDEEHLGTLENVIQQFGDVLSAAEALALLDK